MRFEPIAIVGRGCVLPDALDPQALWANIAAGRVSLSPAPEGRWRLPHSSAMSTPDDATDRTWSDIGGYVRGFDEVFDESGLLTGPGSFASLDPVFQWAVHGAGQALREAGGRESVGSAGLVLGNLSFPTARMGAFAESVWFGGRLPTAAVDPRNRFSSGLPAHLAAAALGLDACAFAIDAACASALYAVKLACDRLHDRTADLMVAGAVNCTDDLFIHTGFCALSALSRSGRSRPFDQSADGLIPAEGASFVALMRLTDAVVRGKAILGVIRGIGLSNDGRSGGFLVPAEEGQERAMRLAYASAGLDPATVSLLECHATGTPVGDAAEVRSTARVFADSRDLPTGSVKANLGHPITAAGTTGLLKVLGAMSAGVRPATVGIDAPIDELRGTPLRLLRAAEEWAGPRRAAISAFGFGGNNAHLIVDEWTGDGSGAIEPMVPTPRTAEPVAIVSIGARVGNGTDTADLVRALITGTPDDGPRERADVDLAGLRFPPVDLHYTHAQQLLALEAARDAVAGVRLPRERTSVLMGMGCDPAVARHGGRWRVGAHLAEAGVAVTDLSAWQDAFEEPLTAARVVGTMPNIVANRVNAQLDLAGPSFTVSAEQASGIIALQAAARALREDEIDAAVVGASDLSHEPVHQEAARALDFDTRPGDGAVVLVLKRLPDAQRDGDPVLALLDESTDSPDLVIGDGANTAPHGFDPADWFGSPHAAHGLLAVAAAALALRHRVLPRLGSAADPLLDRTVAEVRVPTMSAPQARVRLRAAAPKAWISERPSRPHVFSGPDRAAVLARLDAEDGSGPARLVVLAADDAQLAARKDAARSWLEGVGRRPEGVAFRDSPVSGDVAFVYTGGTAAYQGMGRELMLAFPAVVDALGERCGSASSVIGWAHDGRSDRTPHVLEQIWGSAFLAHLHTAISRDLLGLRPSAVLGYSSGETTAVSALGAWTEIAAMLEEAKASSLFSTDLTGEFTVMADHWAEMGIRGGRWASHLVSVEAARVEDALRSEPAVHLMTVNAPDSCVIGGEASACQRVLSALGSPASLRISYPISVHIPEAIAVRDKWWNLHHRPTRAPEGIRFYSNVTNTWYSPTAESVADALTDQAMGTIDFCRTTRAAWDDGVRIFVEHGPRGLCANWLSRTLADRDHVAVSLDSGDDRGLAAVTKAVIELMAAGVDLDSDALFDHLAAAGPSARPDRRTVSLPAHRPQVTLPAVVAGTAGAVSAPPSPQAPVTAAAVPSSVAAAATPAPVLMPPAPVGIGAAFGVAPTPPSSALAPPSQPVAADRPASTQPPGALAWSPPAARAGAVSPVAAAVLAHRNYLVQQAEAHARFLSMSERLAGMLIAVPPAAHPTPVEAVPQRDDLPAPPPRPAPPSTPTAVVPPPELPVRAANTGPVPPATGVTFSRADLEKLAGGRISELFGPGFAAQDGYHRQTRMPQPPMLLADRVTGIDAVPRSMGTGTMWTETDVSAESWYLDPAGRMPAGIMTEAGQADLLLISWLGVDLLNKGERFYRLLGCELTFKGSPAKPGETLVFDIHVDGHGEHDGVRLFFFHYDCRVNDEIRLSMRNGQAGFFTDAELAATKGILWRPEDDTPDPEWRCDPPARITDKRSFTSDEVRAFAAGRPFDCFGQEWTMAKSHVRTPRIADGRMLFLDEVAEFDPDGGPWGRGYLRAETDVSPDDWFFDGHFLNDPCMPGTLMFEGGIQAIAFYLAAQGYTVDRDGWRFEPVPDQPCLMKCRGQVTPESKHLTYEIFVSEVIAGPHPTVIADILCSVDGLKAFHAKRFGLRLVPDWPLDHWRLLGQAEVQRTGDLVPLPALGGLVDHTEERPVAEVDGFTFGYHSLLSCAWGRPSEAFGPFYDRFDAGGSVARLPGPPYHFMTRISSIDGPIGGMREGTTVEAEYDVPTGVWHTEQNDGVVPFAVLMEIALQPCGWLASYVGCAVQAERDLLFRNLDGTATVTAEVRPGDRVRTRATLKSISRTPDMIIVAFDVESAVDNTIVYRMDTVFGFFPEEAFTDQPGLPTAQPLASAGPVLTDLTIRPAKFCSGSPHLPGPMLLMIDRVLDDGPGRLRAEKNIDADEWFFKAHFMSDSVQPGSLGVEAICQLLQYHLIDKGAGRGMTAPHFESVALDEPVVWKYRGQVVPTNTRVTITADITAEDDTSVTADASLWVDGKRIYHVSRITVRVIESASRGEELIDPAEDTWINHHCPTLTVPALPMMSMVDRLVAAVDGAPTAVSVRDVRLRRWVRVLEPARLRTEVDGDQVTLLAWRQSANPALSRFEPVATATVNTTPPPRPAVWSEVADSMALPDPYADGSLFHGPAFQHLTSLRRGPTGASGVLDATPLGVPRGALHQGLLDAVTHVIPHDALWRWAPEIPPDHIGYPHRITSLDLWEALPESGPLRVVARFDGFDDGDPAHPAFRIQVSRDDRVVLEARLVDVLMPSGPTPRDPGERRAFIRDRVYVPGALLSTTTAEGTMLHEADVDVCDWLPGTVAGIYGLPSGDRGRDHLAVIAVKDHVAGRTQVHPCEVEVDADLRGARLPDGRHFDVLVKEVGGRVLVKPAGPGDR